MVSLTIAREVDVLVERSLRRTVRNRGLLISYLFAPLLYLLIFTKVFGSVGEFPNFQKLGYSSYLQFFVPGLLVMSVLQPALTSGLAMVTDIYTGVLDSFLRTPVHRSAILLGRLVADAIRMILQVTLLLVLALVLGAQFRTGIGGAVLIVFLVTLFGVSIASFSNWIGLRTRKIESTGALSNLLVLPLTFASTIFMPRALMPGWLRTAVLFNPITYVVDACRTLTTVGYVAGPVLRGVGATFGLAIFLIGGATLEYRRNTGQ